MSSPATMKLPELPPAQMQLLPPDILREILYRIDPARMVKIPQDRINEAAKIHLASNAEILRLEAQIRTVQAAAYESAAKLL